MGDSCLLHYCYHRWITWSSIQLFKCQNYKISQIVSFNFNQFQAHNSTYTIFSYVRTNFQKVFECLLVAAASAFVGFITLFVVDDCQPIGINPNLTEVTKLWCPKGQYSAVANLFFQNPEESVKSLFHSPISKF